MLTRFQTSGSVGSITNGNKGHPSSHSSVQEKVNSAIYCVGSSLNISSAMQILQLQMCLSFLAVSQGTLVRVISSITVIAIRCTPSKFYVGDSSALYYIKGQKFLRDKLSDKHRSETSFVRKLV